MLLDWTLAATGRQLRFAQSTEKGDVPPYCCQIWTGFHRGVLQAKLQPASSIVNGWKLQQVLCFFISLIVAWAQFDIVNGWKL